MKHDFYNRTHTLYRYLCVLINLTAEEIISRDPLLLFIMYRESEGHSRFGSIDLISHSRTQDFLKL